MMALLSSLVKSSVADTILPSDPSVANDLDAFIKLSELITGTSNIDRETAQNILTCIQNEPWGKEHLVQIAKKLLPQYATESIPSQRSQLLDPKRFEAGERWFLGHFLTTWFTGIYYHQSSRVVTYEHALMFTALSDVRPLPAYCAGEFGFWARPPESISI